MRGAAVRLRARSEPVSSDVRQKDLSPCHRRGSSFGKSAPALPHSHCRRPKGGLYEANTRDTPIRCYPDCYPAQGSDGSVLKLRQVLERVLKRYVAVQYVTVRYVMIRVVAVQYVTVRYVMIRVVTVQYVTVRGLTVQYMTVRVLTVRAVLQRYAVLGGSERFLLRLRHRSPIPGGLRFPFRGCRGALFRFRDKPSLCRRIR